MINQNAFMKAKAKKQEEVRTYNEDVKIHERSGESEKKKPGKVIVRRFKFTAKDFEDLPVFYESKKDV